MRSWTPCIPAKWRRVTITLADGAAYRSRRDVPKGDPSYP